METVATAGPRPSRRRRWATVAVIVLAVLALLAYLGASLIVYDRLSLTRAKCASASGIGTPAAFTVPDRDIDTGPYLMPEFEDVRFASRGDPAITIAAWWIPADRGVEEAGADREPGPTVIVVHGQDSCRRDPRYLLPAGMLHRHGIDVLMIDMRDHGDSTVEDGRFAAGNDEYADVLGAWDFLRARGVAADQIGILGFSLGAATSMIAFGEEPQVAAVWADSSYGDIGEAVRDELTRNGYPTILEHGAAFVGRVLHGDDIKAHSPLEAAVSGADRAIMIVHGGADDRLSPRYATELGEAIRAAGGSVQPWIVPGAGHIEGVIRAPEPYERRLAEFFGTALDG